MPCEEGEVENSARRRKGLYMSIRVFQRSGREGSRIKI